MPLENVITAIGSVGFPIVACVGLFYYMTKQREAHQEETSKLSDAINKLEIVMAKILTRLGGDDDE